MKLTAEQQQALDKIHNWLNQNDDWEFRLGGFAGTGKTFLLQHLINTYNKKVLCCAPTGKAASVLKSKLNGIEVITIHKALYQPVSPSSSEIDRLIELSIKDPGNAEIHKKIEEEKKRLAELKVGFSLKMSTEISPGQLVIIDEASMVTKQMRNDLKNTGSKVLFVGDPGQLPPVGDGGWFVNGELGFVLQTVQRQALDSPIVRMSMEIRDGTISKKDYSDGLCRIISKKQIDGQEWLSADQVITGRNSTRYRLNRFFRNKLGYSGELPNSGEKLICLKNEEINGEILTNGVICEAISNARFDEMLRKNLIDLEYENNTMIDVEFYDYHFRANYQNDLVKDPWFFRKDMREFDYAYAITVHKSQGSEWGKVIIADDKMNQRDKEFRKRWLYTAVTRAKEELIWVQD